MFVRYYTILLCSILIYQEYRGKKKIDNIFFIKGSPSIFDIDITHMCKKVAKMTGFFCEYHLFYLAKENNIVGTYIFKMEIHYNRNWI